MSNAYKVELANNKELAKIHAVNEISRVGVVAVTVSTVIIGCWAMACLFSGLLSSDGTSTVLDGLAKAITG